MNEAPGQDTGPYAGNAHRNGIGTSAQDPRRGPARSSVPFRPARCPMRPACCPMRPSALVRLVLALPLLGALGCDGSDEEATLYVAYAAEVSTATDVYVNRRRVLDDAAPGTASTERTVGVNSTRFDLVPQLDGATTLGTRRFVDLDDGDNVVAMVIGTTRPTPRSGGAADTLGLASFAVPPAGQVRFVNTTMDTLTVALGPGTPVRLGGFGVVSEALPFAPGQTATATGGTGGAVTVTLGAGTQAVAIGARTAYAFTGPAPKTD